MDPYRRHRPIRLGIHIRATDDLTGEAVTVRNHDLPSPELALLRFDVARGECSGYSSHPEWLGHFPMCVVSCDADIP
jgi:hypothetical protein